MSRTGLRGAVAIDGTSGGSLGRGAGARLEAAYVQGYYVVRISGAPNQKINENAFELAGVVRSPLLAGAKARVFGGPVLAVGQGCGSVSYSAECQDGRWSKGRTRVGGAIGMERGWRRRAVEVVVDLRAHWFASDAEAGRNPALTAGLWLRRPR